MSHAPLEGRPERGSPSDSSAPTGGGARLSRALGLATLIGAGLALLVAWGSRGEPSRRFVQSSSPDQVTAPGREPLPEPARQLTRGDKAPALVLPDLDGRLISLHDFRGRRVLLNVWASWCPPCIEEMPSLQRLHAAAGEDLVVLTACVDEDLPAARRIIARLGLRMPVLLDPGGQRLATWGTVKYPETWILDADGVVRERVIGARDWSAPGAVAR